VRQFVSKNRLFSIKKEAQITKKLAFRDGFLKIIIKKSAKKDESCKIDMLLDASTITAIILNTVLKEDIIITRKGESRFKLVLMRKNKKKFKSSLEDTKVIKTNITMSDILCTI